MRNWKTTFSGLATAGFAFVAFSPDSFSHYPMLIALSKFAMVGGLAGMGIFSKDHSNNDAAK